MIQSRRIFLQALGAGIAVISLPDVSSIFGLLPSVATAEEDIAAALRKLFLGDDAGRGPFVAHAETIVTESSPQQLLGSPSALMGILEQLGIQKTFNSRVGYDEAAQCRSNFEVKESDWRKRLGEDAIYTDVRRSPSDKDVAVLVGGNVNRSNNTLYYAEGAVQYQQNASVPMTGSDPGVILAAPAVVREHVGMSNKELAQSFALMATRRAVEMSEGQRAYRYETPVSSVIHIPRPRRNNRVGVRAVGVIAVSNKREPSNIYFADLYE